MTPNQIRLFIEALFIFGTISFAVWTGYHFTREHYEKVIAQDKIIAAQKIEEAQINNDILKTRLEKDHAIAEQALNTLLDAPAPRVRLPKTCPQINQVIPASGNQLPDAATERATDRGQELLDAAIQHLESKAAEWSRALNNCQVVIDWAKAQ